MFPSAVYFTAWTISKMRKHLYDLHFLISFCLFFLWVGGDKEDIVFVESNGVHQLCLNPKLIWSAYLQITVNSCRNATIVWSSITKILEKFMGLLVNIVLACITGMRAFSHQLRFPLDIPLWETNSQWGTSFGFIF